MVSSNQFAVAYRNSTEEDKIAIHDWIESGNKEAIRSWIAVNNEIRIGRLRAKARDLGIKYYAIKSRENLEKEIGYASNQ